MDDTTKADMGLHNENEHEKLESTWVRCTRWIPFMDSPPAGRDRGVS